MLKVMTFNIKNNYYHEVVDGRVSERLKKIFQIIEKENPDVLGLQEVTEEVKKLITKFFVNYNIIGRSRYNNGKKSDEYNIIMVKKNFPVIDSATYSLGKDIHKVGSKYTLDFFPRICTYVKIAYKGEKINIYNTHLDHLLNYNRKRQMKIIKKLTESIKKEPIIIMGDLNMSRNNKILKDFLGQEYTNVSDTLNTPTYGRRYIDHILINNRFILKDVYVDNVKNYPSDHFPIITEVELK